MAGSARIVNAATGVIDDAAVGGLVSGDVPYGRDELGYAQQIYAAIDEPDGLAGIGALRSRLLASQAAAARGGGGGGGGEEGRVGGGEDGSAAGALLSVRERLIDYEHEDRWGDALLCYEQALQAATGDGGPRSSDADAELHAGMLRCLQNVGHLETALNHAVGVVGRRPDLSPAVTPAAVEAAWRLGRWEPLEELLAFQRGGGGSGGSGGNGASGAVLGAARGGGSGTGPVMVDIVADYATSLGSALLQLHKEAVVGGGHRVAAIPAIDGLAVRTHNPTAGALLPALLHEAIVALPRCVTPLDGDAVAAATGLATAVGARFVAVPPPGAAGVGALLRPARGGASVAVPAGQTGAFAAALAAARQEVMMALSAAAMESYMRAYPCLLRLHCLRELERASSLVGMRSTAARSDAVAAWGWDARLAATQPSMAHREPLLALRRSLFAMFGMREREAGGWLEVARTARAAGNASAATAALLHAGGLGSEVAAIQTAKLLYSRGEVHRALVALEPIERDVGAVVASLKAGVEAATAAKDAVAVAAARRACELEAKRLLHATNWMVESRLAGEAAVVARYKAVIELHMAWEKGHFHLGRYYDTVFRALLRDEPCPSATTDRSGAASWTARRDAIVIAIIAYYGNSLRFGHAHVFHSLPRILTLFFDYGAAAEAARGAGGGSGGGGGDHAVRSGMVHPSDDTLRRMLETLAEVRTKMAGYRWMTVLPQLASRICHRHREVHRYIETTLSSILYSFAQQASWFLMGLTKSEVKLRKQRAENVVTQVVKAAGAAPGGGGRRGGGGTSGASGTSGTAAPSPVPDALRLLSKLFDELSRVAAEVPPTTTDKDRSYTVAVLSPAAFAAAPLLLPLQASLTVNLAAHDTVEVANGFVRDAPTIVAFEPRGEYMASKERPKKLTVAGSDGRRYHFLCKQERRGDLRKDARMMEVAGLVNRLLGKDAGGRRRDLRLRTFAVVILKEDCGLLQWVANTTGLRNEVTRAYAHVGAPNPMATTRAVKDELDALQGGDGSDAEKGAAYRATILPRFPAVFHKWFLLSFPDPTTWFEARLRFTRSAAVWSMVGHIVGLGDRHGENILLDRSTGEVVHVDFDCLFDKGLTLQRPEIVPFRLTPNMLDGMGLCGYEGVFRLVSEAAMRVLRANRDMLVSVLESFVHDPLVEWARNRAAASGGGGGGGAGAGGALVGTAAGGETENRDGLRMVKRLAERLDGLYNAGIEAAVPHAGWKCSRATAGGGSKRFGASMLSISGQVQRLLAEATSDANLALMYIGWMPFL